MLEQRASMNEEAVHNCLEYFKEAKEARNSEAYVQQQELQSKIMS